MGSKVRKSGGRVPKLVAQVQQLSFNGPYVAGMGRQLRYITERAVFELRGDRLTLIEVAPGITVQDVLAVTGAAVAVAPDVKPIDARVFTRAPMFARAR